jgi:hypothetical protein
MDHGIRLGSAQNGPRSLPKKGTSGPWTGLIEVPALGPRWGYRGHIQAPFRWVGGKTRTPKRPGR